MPYFTAAPNSISAGDPPQTLLGELPALPQTPAGFKGPTSKGRGWEGLGLEGREGMGGGRGEGGEGKGEEGEGREGRVPKVTPPL